MTFCRFDKDAESQSRKVAESYFATLCLCDFVTIKNHANKNHNLLYCAYQHWQLCSLCHRQAFIYQKQRTYSRIYIDIIICYGRCARRIMFDVHLQAQNQTRKVLYITTFVFGIACYRSDLDDFLKSKNLKI